MIVRMRKVTLLVRAGARDEALQDLGRLGVVHLRPVRQATSDDLEAVVSEQDRTVRALSLLGSPAGQAQAIEDPAGMVGRALEHGRRREELRREAEELQEQRRWFEEWGSVSWASVQRLAEAGLVVRFYVADREAVRQLPTDRFIQVVGDGKKSVRLMQVAPSAEIRLDLKEEFMPQVEVAALDVRLAQVQVELEQIEQALAGLVSAAPGLLAYQEELGRRLEFAQAKQGMGEEASIAFLQGFCPIDDLARLKETADRQGWAYLIEEPTAEDEVPTLIRTPRWLSIVNPVFEFMGTVPGYQEHDISFWFLIFFSVFFAMLIGDAAYGLLVLGLTFHFSRKFPKAPRQPFALMYVLGGATLVWGALSGTWFGYQPFAQLPLLRSLVVERVNSFVDANQDFMIYLCFIIGALHLSVARALNAVRLINSLKALAEVGWIVILWSMFFVAGWIILGNPLPGGVRYSLGIGVALVLLFANAEGNLLKGVLVTLSDLPLKVISSFSDIVSYLRLFAVGTAGLVLSTTFNNMAGEMAAGSAFGTVMACLVLAVGHGINLVLGLMAVVVHGIRLNMLEFSGHLSMEWSGKNYRPFKT